MYAELRALDEALLTAPGVRIEVGGGSTFMNRLYADVVSSDLKPAEHLDLVADALNLPLRAGSARALYLINCFHHLPDPGAFFAELHRVLAPGGGCLMVEPYFGPLARFFYARVFDTETYEPSQRDWIRPEAAVMHGANQALAWIVFERDRERFSREFADLRVVHARPLRSWVRYLLSGGLNFRQMVPQPLAPLLRGAEAALWPFRRLVALHHVVVLRKERIQFAECPPQP
jgi:SAM-dependent methyltransferase